MSKGTDLKRIHKVSVKDISKNFFLIGTVILSFTVCLSGMLVNVFRDESLTEEKRWMIYAGFMLISAFAMPLIYFIRYGDRNKQIINTLIYTKMRNTALYQHLIGLYHVIIFTAVYGIFVLLLSIWDSVHFFDIWLLLSVMCVQCIVNGICILCLSNFRRFYVGMIVYMCLCFFLFASNNVLLGFLFPLNYENYGILYFVGKVVELFLIGLVHSIICLIAVKYKKKGCKA
ncbi:MAG: hypothetical protein NC389_13810 [Acetatifactor muris]|nr:hypothetical protein [Acetatifactor muris]